MKQELEKTPGATETLAKVDQVRMCTLHDDVRFQLKGRGRILADVSGSMGSNSDHRVTKRPIDELREAVKNFPGILITSFSDDVYENTIPEPQMGTALDIAFNYLNTAAVRSTFDFLILISDGAPNDETAAYVTGKALGCPINVLYIGAKNTSGERFMKGLAEATGGIQVSADMRDITQQLTAGIRGLLGAGSPEPKGPIHLGGEV